MSSLGSSMQHSDVCTASFIMGDCSCRLEECLGLSASCILDRCSCNLERPLVPALCTHFLHSTMLAGVQSPAIVAPAGVLQEALSLQAAAAAREEQAMADFATPSRTTPVGSGHQTGKGPY